MDPSWLSNAYLVADRAGGTAVFVDSGAPIEPLVAAVQRLEVVLLPHPGSLAPHPLGDRAYDDAGDR